MAGHVGLFSSRSRSADVCAPAEWHPSLDLGHFRRSWRSQRAVATGGPPFAQFPLPGVSHPLVFKTDALCRQRAFQAAGCSWLGEPRCLLPPSRRPPCGRGRPPRMRLNGQSQVGAYGYSACRRGRPGVAPALKPPGLRKLRKIAEDSGRSLNGHQVFVIERETTDCGTPETPGAEDGAIH